jgi:hypothetical protein
MLTPARDRKFYKYMSASTVRKVLDNSSFRWALPKTFNDPFDVQFDLRVEYDRDRVIEQVLQNQVDLYMGRRHVPKENKLAQAIKMLQRTRPGLKDEDIRDQFRESLKLSMDAVEKNLPKNRDDLRRVLEPLKLLCLSEIGDNILMWAHYADHHKGTVLELSYIKEVDSTWGAAKPVRYRKEMPYLFNEEKIVRVLSGEGTIAGPELFEEAIFVKAIDWAYEKEWRMVGGWEYDKDEEYITFKPQEVTGIYLGCRMTDEDKEAVKALAAKKYAHTPVYQGLKSKDCFAVEFTKL